MTDTELVKQLQERINTMQFAIDALQRIAADLNAENVALKQQIARMELGHKQTIYPWKAE